MEFSWVPFYREVAERVLGYDNWDMASKQGELLALLHEMEKAGFKPIFLEENQFSGPKTPLKEIDPFTFLSSFSFTGDEKAGKMCQWLKKRWKLKIDAPTDFDGRVKVLAQNPWFFASIADGRGTDDISILWELAGNTINHGFPNVDDDVFGMCMRIPNIGIKKLTTGLSWLDPVNWISLAGPILPYLEGRGVEFDKKKLQNGDFDEYKELIQKVRSIESNLLVVTHNAWQERRKEGQKQEEQSFSIVVDSEELVPVLPLPQFPLNQILYGPPGTGKTFSVIERAVEIITGRKLPHSEAKSLFDELRQVGQIEFVTFHQSFSYEEFIEGLRPILSEGGDGNARYEVRDGVLKALALQSLETCIDVVNPYSKNFDELWFILLHRIQLSPTYRIQHEDESGCSYRLDVREDGTLRAINVNAHNLSVSVCSEKQVEIAWYKLRNAVNVDYDSVRRAVGDEDEYSPHLIASIILELRKHDNKQFQSPKKQDVTEESVSSFLKGSREYCLRDDLAQAPRYVLIVDEINRGNISKILGELITLLEPDKRIGADNELRVQLPVSGEQFGLPPNLYLLGTMNTADKSLALLDVALRRRFDFIEMAPQSLLFPDYARDVLTQLNLRLEAALDREHRIGHAVFINCKSESNFNEVFRKKIIPLLQEFFYNDWETLRAVLGESGDSGRFIKKLIAPSGMKARTKWRWWFDEDETDEFDILGTLRKNYN